MVKCDAKSNNFYWGCVHNQAILILFWGFASLQIILSLLNYNFYIYFLLKSVIFLSQTSLTLFYDDFFQYFIPKSYKVQHFLFPTFSEILLRSDIEVEIKSEINWEMFLRDNKRLQNLFYFLFTFIRSECFLFNMAINNIIIITDILTRLTWSGHDPIKNIFLKKSELVYYDILDCALPQCRLIYRIITIQLRQPTIKEFKTIFFLFFY